MLIKAILVFLKRIVRRYFFFIKANIFYIITILHIIILVKEAARLSKYKTIGDGGF